VAVPVPSLDLLTYSVPDEVAAPAIGARVVVPLGSRIVTGIVIEVGSSKELGTSGATAAIKPIHRVLDADAFVPADVVALARWTAEYYAAGVGDTIPALLPPMARGGRADAHKTSRVASITVAGIEAVAADALPLKQREALELLAGSPEGIPTAALASRGVAAGAVARLARRGYVSVRQDRVDRDPFKVSDTSPTRVGDVSETPRTPLGDVSDTCQTGVRHV
jgi:primosomal protein N'